jgi:alpha-galactosidase/6-phospho-beta-glucosidase family protein
MAGVNHFTFTLALRERDTGKDVLADFIAGATRAGLFEHRTAKLVEETGCWPANGDCHMRDFLPPDKHSRPLASTSHGTAGEREERMIFLREAAAGTRAWEPLLAHRAWEKPIDFAAALAGGAPAHFHSLNLANEGQLPDLPREAFVETPADVDARGPAPSTQRLPEAVARLSRPVAELSALIAQAGLTGRRDLVHRAVELDPTIIDKRAGRAAVDACLEAHADLIAAR